MIRRRFLVQGLVQGVGFRPFVARLALEIPVNGHVENTTRGVEIEVQGTEEAVAVFHRGLTGQAPPMAEIHSVESSDIVPRRQESGFEIRASRVDPISSAVIPPDIATCPACLTELLDPADRRFGYPFTNCTDCGPRYTVIASLPYDRARTSMAAFALCPACAAEYGDPASRRFHAQPNACPACGPRLTLLDGEGEALPGDPIDGAIETLQAGGVVALMGLGGFHLACDATCEPAVVALRRRKNRPVKPFAVMVPDRETAGTLAELDPEAEAVLSGPRAPILLVPARPDSPLPPQIAPGQDRLGLFLPYTPLHHLLFRRGRFRALVMTSGNHSDEPILSSAGEALEKLHGVADRFLVHDRPILHRADDSVVKMTGSGPVVLRRARGYAPAPIPLANPSQRVILALGAELASAVCVVRGSYAYLGPHLGDLKNLDVEEALRESVEHLLGLLRVEPDLVVCDLHPQYRSSACAAQWEAGGVAVLRVQHHEAHAAACMAENGFRGDGIALALDGLGHGRDETIWGGELLAGRPGRFSRIGHLVQVPQPGGDKAAQEPWRMAASHLRRLLGPRWATLPLPAFAGRDRRERDIVDTLIAKGLQSPLTSSCGRLFDAAASLLGFGSKLRYSAQAAMELESLAALSSAAVPAYPCEEPSGEGPVLLDPAPLLLSLLDDVLAGRERGECSLAFHRGLARLFALGAAEASRRTGLADVFLSGGCVQNGVFADCLIEQLHSLGLRPYVQHQIPPNDGGICFGQAAWALGSLTLTED